jgi:hypothetical protein
MNSTTKTSTLFLTFLLLTSANVFAGKSYEINCPCHVSEPGWIDVISEISAETCVTEQLLWYDNHAGEKWLGISVLTLNEADTCLLSYVTSEFSTCAVMKGEMHGDDCAPGAADTLILDISEEQYKDCDFALRTASQFLWTTSRCR